MIERWDAFRLYADAGFASGMPPNGRFEMKCRLEGVL
jgi:hypothetical protein